MNCGPGYRCRRAPISWWHFKAGAGLCTTKTCPQSHCPCSAAVHWASVLAAGQGFGARPAEGAFKLTTLACLLHLLQAAIAETLVAAAREHPPQRRPQFRCGLDANGTHRRGTLVPWSDVHLPGRRYLLGRCLRNRQLSSFNKALGHSSLLAVRVTRVLHIAEVLQRFRRTPHFHECKAHTYRQLCCRDHISGGFGEGESSRVVLQCLRSRLFHP
mmetsp:Transcript_85356/g.198465  ORF Transcript_85356/g.198465 Transcript_85356/m.198465 type:complete len:215 (-) Transcript_85356:175-819(-)